MWYILGHQIKNSLKPRQIWERRNKRLSESSARNAVTSPGPTLIWVVPRDGHQVATTNQTSISLCKFASLREWKLCRSSLNGQKLLHNFANYFFLFELRKTRTENVAREKKSERRASGIETIIWIIKDYHHTSSRVQTSRLFFTFRDIKGEVKH